MISMCQEQRETVEWMQNQCHDGTLVCNAFSDAYVHRPERPMTIRRGLSLQARQGTSKASFTASCYHWYL
jgi:hypothetical protein